MCSCKLQFYDKGGYHLNVTEDSFALWILEMTGGIPVDPANHPLWPVSQFLRILIIIYR